MDSARVFNLRTKHGCPFLLQMGNPPGRGSSLFVYFFGKKSLVLRILSAASSLGSKGWCFLSLQSSHGLINRKLVELSPYPINGSEQSGESPQGNCLPNLPASMIVAGRVRGGMENICSSDFRVQPIHSIRSHLPLPNAPIA